MAETVISDYYDLDTDTGYVFIRPRPTQAIIEEILSNVFAHLEVDPEVRINDDGDVLELSLKTQELPLISKIGSISVTTIASMEYEYGNGAFTD